MKKIFIILILILITIVKLNAATLKWDAASNATGYIIYFNEFNYTTTELQVPDIDDTLNLHPGTTYTFSVTAYNDLGESEKSNSVDYTTADSYVPIVNNIPVKKELPPIIFNFIIEK